jgi:hypothetical protein
MSRSVRTRRDNGLSAVGSTESFGFEQAVSDRVVGRHGFAGGADGVGVLFREVSVCLYCFLLALLGSGWWW